MLLEALRRDFGNQWVGLSQAVAWVATEHGLYPALQDTRIVQLDASDEAPLRACVEQLLAEGVLALGIDGRHAQWPWLSVTEHGQRVVSEGAS